MSTTLQLLALEYFAEGEQGHAVRDKVIRFRAGLVVDDGIVVRALEYVSPGTRGRFEAITESESTHPPA